MDKSVVRQLFRQSLRVVACAEKSPGLARLAEARWAEFVPSAVRLQPGDGLRAALRQCFRVAPLTPEHVANGFGFLRQASPSLLSLELAVLWEELASPQRAEPSREPYDLVCGMALLSAALDVARTESQQTTPGFHSQAQALRQRRRLYERWLRDYLLAPLLVAGDHAERQKPLSPTVPCMNHYTSTLKRRFPWRRNEARPEDFTLASVVERGQGAECVLNTLLLLKLAGEATLHCSFAGTDLVFPWVRVDRNRGGAAGGSAPVFASWSYGAVTSADVERIAHTGDARWSRPHDAPPCSPADARKGVLIVLLRKQLASLSSGEVRSRGGASLATSVCKEQLIHLLSL